jgi:predicted component of type VI protein secretion system
MIPLVVIVESKDGRTRRYAFGDSPVRVGRSPFAELQLTEAFVSRWEGTLRFDENEVTYFHVSQTNPTYVDGRAAGVHEEVPIGPTTVLTLGELKLRFERTAVRDEDVRRKGKRQPIKSDDETVAKTVWLDASKKIDPKIPAHQESSEHLPGSQQAYLPEQAPPVAAYESRPPPSYESSPPARPSQPDRPSTPRLGPTEGPATSSPSQPPAVLSRPAVRPSSPEVARPSARPEAPRASGSDSVRIAREVRVLPVKAIVTPAHGSARPDSAGASQRPGVSDHVQSLMRPPGGFASEPPPDTYTARALEPRPSSPAEGRAWDSSGSGSGPRLDRNDLDALHAEYRVSWEELCSALTRKLESTPDGQRKQLAEQLQRRFPAIAQEPEYRAVLQRFRLEAPSTSAPSAPSAPGEQPELGAWLRKIAEGVLPEKFNPDPARTLERVLSLLELLTQSFAEINDAQDNIRRHWLGRAPRSSILRSDNGRVILAYMLNPKADWGDRLGELESAISDVVMHELSLFKATLEGARGLVESLSPAALAKAEGIDLAALEEGGSGSGFLGRLLPRDTPEGRLWRRFMSTYEGLMDGDRYQRLFLGRKFARTYLAAMGQREGSDEREKPGGSDK